MSLLKAERRSHLAPRIKIWLEIEGLYAYGFGLSEILRAVDQSGSIKQAAADVGKSYRYVWGRIKRAEKTLVRQLVETQVGGKDGQRSSLTDEARCLVGDFQAIRLRMIRAVQEEFARHLLGRAIGLELLFPGHHNANETQSSCAKADGFHSSPKRIPSDSGDNRVTGWFSGNGDPTLRALVLAMDDAADGCWAT
jgi:molybdate transport repressor ModE-like protein